MINVLEMHTFDLKKGGVMKLLQRLFKDSRGSFMVESAIVFPIVILVVLVLITLTLLLHDQYVADIAVYLQIQETVVNDKIGDKEVVTERINKVIRDSSILKVDGVQVDHSLNKIKVTKNYRLPIVGQLNESKKEYPVGNGDQMNNVKVIELMEDVFDYMTFSDTMRTKYSSLLKTVKTLLESY